jgi:hypothetical protein
MKADWLEIYTTSELYKAEMVRQILADHGIEAVVMNQQDSLYRFGEIKVYVSKEDHDAAEEIVNGNEL